MRHAVNASPFGLRFQGKGYFLTDARTHRGTSGAPVVMRSRSGALAQGELPWTLLGIHSGSLDMRDRQDNLDEWHAAVASLRADLPEALLVTVLLPYDEQLPKRALVDGLDLLLRALVDGTEVAELPVDDRNVPVMLESTARGATSTTAATKYSTTAARSDHEPPISRGGIATTPRSGRMESDSGMGTSAGGVSPSSPAAGARAQGIEITAACQACTRGSWSCARVAVLRTSPQKSMTSIRELDEVQPGVFPHNARDWEPRGNPCRHSRNG